MGRPLVEDLQQGFAGGLNTSADSSQMSANEVRRAENARLTEYGGIQKRRGTQRMHSTSISSINGGFAWMQPTTSYHFVAAGGSVKTSPLGTAPLTWTTLTGSIASTGLIDFAAFRDGSGEIVYIADGGALNKADATTLTTNLAGTPNAVSLTVYNQRLYAVDGTTQTLYASAINNGDSLGVTGSGGIVAIIRSIGNQECFAVRTLRSSLAIFHRSGISRFTGITIDDIDIDEGVQGFSEQVGTIAKKSLVSVEGEVFFFAEQGFYRLSETGLENISLKIDTVTRAVPSDVINRIVGAHDKLRHEVRWYVPDVGVYVYNYVLKAWSGPWNGIYKTSGVRAMWNTEAAGSLPSQVFIGSTDGFVRLCDSSTGLDDALAEPPGGGGAWAEGAWASGAWESGVWETAPGSSSDLGGNDVTMVVQCHRLFFGDEATEKAFRFGYVLADMRGSTDAYARWRSGVGTTDFTLEGDTTVESSEWGTGLWGAGSWGSGGGTELFEIQGNGRGRYYDFFLYDTGPGETLFSRVRLEAFNMTRR